MAPGQHIILQPARLTRWKGQQIVIEVVAQLDRAGLLQNAVVVMAGDPQGRDDYVEELHGRIWQNGLQTRIVIVGHVEDIAAAYLAAHITIVASVEPEAFGRTAIEAAALGCPVIATNIGAPPRRFWHNRLFQKAKRRVGWFLPAIHSSWLQRWHRRWRCHRQTVQP